MSSSPDHQYRLPYDEFKAIYSRVPRINVELLIFTESGLILTKRSIAPYLGQWHIPGGTIYFGESIDQAARRVAQLELGVTIEVVQSRGYIEYPHHAERGDFGWPIGIAIEARIINGTPRGSEQGKEIGYFKTIPKNTIGDQADFLRANHILAD